MITLRKAKSDDDIREIARLADVIWHEHFTPIIGAGQVEYMLDKFQSYEAIANAVKNDGYVYYMAFDGELDKGELVGYVGAKPEAEGLFLSKIYIRADHRRKGLATALLDLASYDYRNKDYMYLTVNKHNDIAVNSYKALGFYVEKELVTDIGNGFVMDDYVFKIDMKDYLKRKCHSGK